MIPLTITVALIAVALALWVKPPTAIGVLIASMLLYPEYLRLPIGPVNMSAPRFVALAIIVRLAGTAYARGFRWRLIDTLICLEWVWSVTACILAGANTAWVSEVVGRVFDTVPMYFAARLCMLRQEDYRKLVAPLVFCAIIAGGLGVFESMTRIRPYASLQAYTAVQGFDFGGESFGDMEELRYGLLRARGSTGMSLYFGVAMFLLTGVLYSLQKGSRSKSIWAMGFAAALCGSLSSMSSGPQSALVTFFLVGIFYWIPRLIKPALVGLLGLIIFGETVSHRHFWYWIEYLNPLGGDSWYRSRLIDVALIRWRDYGLIGVGSNVPGHWGQFIDGRQFVDIVNEFVIVAVATGLIGLTCRLGILTTAIRDAIWSYRNGTIEVRHRAFAQIATLLGLMVAGMSTGFFGPAKLLSFVLLGMMVRRTAGEPQPMHKIESAMRVDKKQRSRSPVVRVVPIR